MARKPISAVKVPQELPQTNEIHTVTKQVPYTAGSVKQCLEYWKAVTTDPYVLSIVNGYSIEFEKDPIITATTAEK